MCIAEAKDSSPAREARIKQGVYILTPSLMVEAIFPSERPEKTVRSEQRSSLDTTSEQRSSLDTTKFLGGLWYKLEDVMRMN
ncbi:hypothetical protein N7456_000284 [Penicillium angulare]|uniref:Uncharacterized protein n=1 Tax=Penicillium angulare TaxID=116970 RepID=A0A9W9KS55_9EURO|nr:hypothetical protein N7456_000284 [Penicillium angulare]